MDPATRERLALRYAVALDTGDLDAIGPVLDAAATDPLLSDILTEIDRQTADERAVEDRTAPPVRLAHDHLHTEVDTDVLTIGHVAARLSLGPSALDAYTRLLLSSTAPLPASLTAPNVGRLLHEATGEPPSPRYRSAFRSAAVKARMQHDAHQAERMEPALMAARTPRLPKSRS